jgi:hypothetical protein
MIVMKAAEISRIKRRGVLTVKPVFDTEGRGKISVGRLGPFV